MTRPRAGALPGSAGGSPTPRSRASEAQFGRGSHAHARTAAALAVALVLPAAGGAGPRAVTRGVRSPHAAGRCRRLAQRRRSPQLRREDGRHARLLGRQRRRPGHAADGQFHHRERRPTHTCGVKTDGTLACWGDNGVGRAAPPAGSFTAVSAGGSTPAGVRTDGTLACWGHNNEGQATPPAGQLHGRERRRKPQLRG